MESENTEPENNKPDDIETPEPGATEEPAEPEKAGSYEPTLAEIGAQENEKIKAEKQGLPKKPKKKVPLSVTVAIAIIVALVCGFGGFFASGPINASTHSSSATLSGDQLNNVIASYIIDGKSANVTAQEVISGTGASANTDGSYSAPTASTITSYVQNKILNDEADKRGITASDDEAKAYAESSLGTSDYDSVGQQYGLSGQQVKDMMAQTVKTNKLVNEVVGFDTTTPTEPTDPGKSKRSKKTEEFGSYVVDLLGKAGVWDSSTGTWSNTDNDYYKTLGEGFDGKTASYKQAKKVYDTYYKDYQTKMSQASTDWQNYTSDLYGKLQLTIYGVYSS